MKKMMMICFFAAIALIMQSCFFFHVSDSYTDSHLYMHGNSSTDQYVNQIEVDWVNGDVVIEYGEGTMLTWSEEVVRGESNCHTQMHYRVNGNTLQIRYCESGSWNTGRLLEKKLYITLPKDAVYQQIEVESVSGNVTADADAEQIEIETVSGCVYVRDLMPAKQIQVETVSGNVEIRQPKDAAFTIDYSTISGSFQTDFSGTQNGNNYSFGRGGTDMQVETVSGNIMVMMNE